MTCCSPEQPHLHGERFGGDGGLHFFNPGVMLSMKATDAHDEMLEAIAAAVHNNWVTERSRLGFTARRDQSGELLTVPYERLSEDTRELGREMVRSVMDGIIAAGYVVVKQPE